MDEKGEEKAHQAEALVRGARVGSLSKVRQRVTCSQDCKKVRCP